MVMGILESIGQGIVAVILVIIGFFLVFFALVSLAKGNGITGIISGIVGAGIIVGARKYRGN
ncbi:MAG: hypothetical protein MPEBLZ_01790 [Candidatus Methanoperedens nitroreducens]|uniref:Uncharacterized protein n=2 Tax=Candidatus Methanoperedens TaxID=1392997 RepID=A0A0P8A644_9EURY|nr:MAG: hypothetical protein MPEBLZ_01790 [Candidatus Methanoperedens sp. BLZ1]